MHWQDLWWLLIKVRKLILRKYNLHPRKFTQGWPFISMCMHNHMYGNPYTYMYTEREQGGEWEGEWEGEREEKEEFIRIDHSGKQSLMCGHSMLLDALSSMSKDSSPLTSSSPLFQGLETIILLSMSDFDNYRYWSISKLNFGDVNWLIYHKLVKKYWKR